MARFSCNDTCQYGGWCARILLTFCGMLLFLGTGLCIAGFAVFGYTNPRIDTVNQYNTRGAAFEARAPRFGSLSMSIVAGSNSWAAMPATTLVDVAAPTTGVKEFASRAFVAANVPRSSLRSAALRAVDNTSTVTSLDVPIAFAAAPLKRRVAKALQCTRADCGSGSNCQCSTTDMTRKCLTNYNGSWTPDKENGYCQDDERDCGYCEYEATLTALCIPVAFNVTSKSIVPSTKFSTCDYPFGVSDGTYGGASGSTDLVVTIMDETDPYIELQRLTKGTKSFGWDEKSQASVATGLLVAGLVVLSLTIFAICLVVRSNSERVQEAKEAEIRHMHDATEMQPVVAAAPLAVSQQQQQQPTAYPVAPAYPQPQPAYPQPQAPYPAQPYPQPGGASASAAGGAAPSYYGQQQGGMAAYPAYGQMQQQHGGYGGPQPAYGAPQPAYGAQPNYYGGPQPGYGAQQPQYGMAPQQQHQYPPQQVAPQGASSAAASPPRDDNAPRPKVV